MMVRTQISLQSEDHRRAKRRAAELGVSLAEYVRQVVARDLGEPRAQAEASEIFGIIDSGGADVSRHKDDYLREAVEAEHRREVGRRSARR
jgi:hypothetical protein